MRTSLSILLILALLLTGCQVTPTPASGDATTPGAGDEPAGSLEALTIAMGFMPNIQFAPMYVALERGYFAEEGLDITLDYGMETDLLERLAAEQIKFAIGSGDQVILARAQGLPVQYVLNWYRRFPVCIVAMADSGIETIDDLVGKTVGIPVTFGASYIGWMGFVKAVGLDPQAVNLQTIGYTQVARLVEGRVAAAVVYAQNEPVQLRTAGHDINVFYLDEYTALISNGIITNDVTAEEEPELVRAVVRAFLRGLEDTLADPDAAFEIARRAIPEMDDETAVLQRAVLDESIEFCRAERAGATDPRAWEASVTLLNEMGLLATEVDPETLYSNGFLPEEQ